MYLNTAHLCVQLRAKGAKWRRRQRCCLGDTSSGTHLVAVRIDLV